MKRWERKQWARVARQIAELETPRARWYGARRWERAEARLPIQPLSIPPLSMDFMRSAEVSFTHEVVCALGINPQDLAPARPFKYSEIYLAKVSVGSYESLRGS